MRKNIIILYLLISVAPSFGQQVTLAKQWDKRFGGISVDVMGEVIMTSDNGYLLGGASNSGIGGDKTQDNWDTTYTYDDMWVVKIDSIGNKEWDKRFGGISEDYANILQQTKDGGYILAGVVASDSGDDVTQPSRGGFDYWLVKIDSAGNKQWDKRFGGSNDDYLSAMQRTTDGGYILAGFSYSDSSGDKTNNNWGGTDYWVVKTDSAGNKQWDADYGGTGYQFLYAISQTAGGGYILGGVSNSGISGDKTQENWMPTEEGYNFWVVRIDSAGNKLWDRVYGGTVEDDLEAIIQTSDGGFLLGGWTLSDSSGDKSQNTHGGYDYWIVKIDSIGNKLWDRDYGGIGNNYLYSLALTNDKGYLIGGTSEASASGDKSENNLGPVQPWCIKTDSNGYKQWDKTVFANGPVTATNAFQEKNGLYVVGSFTQAEVSGYKSQPAWDSSTDYWIVTFRDTVIFTGVPTITTTGAKVFVSPNPFTNDIAISIQTDGLKQADFTIYNMLGQPVYTKQETNLSPTYTKMLNLSYLPNGIYFVEVVVDGERVVKEVVKE